MRAMAPSSRLSLVTAALLAACAGKPTPSEPAPATQPAAAPAAGDSASRVVTERFASEALGVEKDVVVYLPRGYDADPNRRWPVFYYLHGLTGNETNWVKSGKLDATADQMALEAIVVMPDGDDGFYVDAVTPVDYDKCMATGAGLFMPADQPRDKTCVRARRYESYIAKDLVSWVDGKYRTIASRDGRAIAGLSMGGFGAMELAMRHPEMFASAASHSGALALLYRGPRPFAPGKTELFTDASGFITRAGPIGAWIGQLLGTDIASWRAHDVVSLAEKLPSGKLALYFDCGTEDEYNLQDNVQYVHEALTKQGVEHEFFLGPGKHDFAFWAARLPHSLAFARKHTAKPR